MPQLNDGRLMIIKLNFKNSGSVSAKTELDLLEVRV
jgi:hypothetical protein